MNDNETEAQAGTGMVTVHVRHVGELEKVNFKMSEEATLSEVWDQAYVKLGIQRQDRDLFQAKEGKDSVDLTPHLGLTLRQAAENGIARARQFEIVAGTGGA